MRNGRIAEQAFSYYGAGMAHAREHRDPTRLLEDSGFAQTAAQSIQALATPSRLRILARLHAGPASVNEIAAAVGMEGSAVSHQLRLLRHLGLVTGQRLYQLIRQKGPVRDRTFTITFLDPGV